MCLFLPLFLLFTSMKPSSLQGHREVCVCVCCVCVLTYLAIPHSKLNCVLKIKCTKEIIFNKSYDMPSWILFVKIIMDKESDNRALFIYTSYSSGSSSSSSAYTHKQQNINRRDFTMTVLTYHLLVVGTDHQTSPALLCLSA